MSVGNLILKTPTGSLRLSTPDSGGGGGGDRILISAADIVPLGSYDVAANIAGGDLNYGQGFTHRYVDGQLQFLTTTFYSGGYRLLALPKPAAFGDLITTPTTVWANAKDGTNPWPNGILLGLHWDEAAGTLWSTEGIDYPDDEQAVSTDCLSIRTLNNDGTASGFRGYFGLADRSPRETYGGAVRIPEWFQSAYGSGPVGLGFGGYASRLSAGGTVSLGPTLYSIPEPTDFADGTEFTTSQYKALMTCRSGSGLTDWYASGTPTTFDRGVRNSDVVNNYDDGNWHSPAPDGLGRWVWGDSNWNTGCWIDGPNKHGFLTVPTLCSGNVHYETSTLHRERTTFEIQVFDPVHLGEVALGSRQPWDVKPTTRLAIEPEGLYTETPGEIAGNSPANSIGGATFDATTGILYLYGIWMLASLGLSPNSRIYAYQVNS
jgi:hypothetical protein